MKFYFTSEELSQDIEWTWSDACQKILKDLDSKKSDLKIKNKT